jgi:hypothetical protein
MGFKRLDPEDFVVSSDTVTSTVWSNRTIALNEFYTSSVQKEGSSGPYYLNVYQTSSTDEAAEVQFSIAYADADGGGSIDFDSSVPGVSPSKTIYGQYRTLVLEDENSTFSFGNQEADYFYVISIERARYKEKLLPGSFNLTLSSSNAQLSELHLTDNSGMVTLPIFLGTMRAYEIISGSDGVSHDGGNGFTSTSGSYGLFLPDISTILLSGPALDDNAISGINLQTSRTPNTNANNPIKLFQHLTASFELNSQETITSDYVFVRTRNSEFNYSENPSFISGSTGEVIYDYFIDNPQTFATTVGMYNDSNELLAVAKLSRPLIKDFTKEALVRVKLDF